LAIAQMRDTVEHLRRLDLLSTFPIRLPKHELMATFLVGVVAVLVAIAPNPWLLSQRASNPAVNVAREQAAKVDRLADSLHPEQSQDIQQLRDLVRKGARTIDARSNEPESALNALEDLEQQIRQMSGADDQLAAALSAVASALAGNQNTQDLASAINSGDLRQVAQAAKDLAQRTEQLDGEEKAQVAKVLRDAANRASRASPSAAGDLSDAAAALQAANGADSGNEDANAQAGGQDGRQAGAQSGSNAQNGRSAQDALNSLSSAAASAAERQRAQSQLEASQNALERALGRTQSRSGSSANGTSGRSSASRNNQSNSGEQGSDGSGQGQPSDQSGSGDQGSGGSQGGDGSSGGDEGQGGGYSTGGTPQARTGGTSNVDTITRPEQDTNGGASPDYSSENPYLGDAGDGTSRASDQTVNPSFQRKSTQGNDQASIPLGLRDLVKDYFSSLGQK
jgi:lactocepin